MMQKPKNSYEVYAVSDHLYDARIPSINRQLRVQVPPPFSLLPPPSTRNGRQAHAGSHKVWDCAWCMEMEL